MRISDWSSRRVLFRSLGQFLRQADHRFGRSDRIFPAMTDQYLRLDGRNIGERWCIIDAMKTYDAPQIRTRAGEIANAFDDEAETHCGRRSEEHPSELQSLMRLSYAVFCLIKYHSRLHKPH